MTSEELARWEEELVKSWTYEEAVAALKDIRDSDEGKIQLNNVSWFRELMKVTPTSGAGIASNLVRERIIAAFEKECEARGREIALLQRMLGDNK